MRKVERDNIVDWATIAAQHVDEEYVFRGRRPSIARVAAIIATFAEPLVTLLGESRREHHHEEDDSWYCCGACNHPCDNDDGDHEHDEGCCVQSYDGGSRTQGVCNCGADAWNVKVEEALAGLRGSSRNDERRVDKASL